MNAFNALADQSLKSGNFDYDNGDKPFQNIHQALYEIPEIKEVFDTDVLMYGVERSIISRTQSVPVKFEENSIEEIVEEIVTTLKTNLSEHLIVVPIRSASFDKVIRIDDLTFIPRDHTRKQKLKIIARISKKTLSETEMMVAHTERSTSRDLLNYPLLLIKQTQQKSTIHYSSLNVAKAVIYSIRCFYYGNIYRTTKDKKTLSSLLQNNLPQASHLAVYSKENWRQNHKPLNFDANISFDLKWLEDSKAAKELKHFLERIYFEGDMDELNVTFLNALVLYNESIKQSTSIATISTMMIAESILTQNTSEKRLRISAIIPRLLKYKKSEQREVSEIFDELYQKRNYFVHMGKAVSTDHDFEVNEPTILEKSRIIIARLILSYPKFENELSNMIPANSDTNRTNDWEQYVDSIFRNILY